MPASEVEHLHKRYGDEVAVDDVSFTVECLEGLRVPDRGRLAVLGLDPRRDRASCASASASNCRKSGCRISCASASCSTSTPLSTAPRPTRRSCSTRSGSLNTATRRTRSFRRAAAAVHRATLVGSPVPPSRLLTAQLLVNLAAAVVVVVLIAGVGGLVLGFPLPGNPGGFLLSLVLGSLTLFSVGLLVAAAKPATSTA